MDHHEQTLARQLYADPAGTARQARDKLAAARVWLMKNKPFFGVLARALRLEATLEVSGYRLLPDDRLRFNPIVTMQARFPSLCARLAHVSLHAALGAFGRRRGREPRRWNVAHDLAIGSLLDAAELSVGLTTMGAMRELPAGASAEAYYDLLDEGVAPDALWCDLSDPEPRTDAPPDGQFTRQDDGTEEGDEERTRDGEASGPATSPDPEVTPDAQLEAAIPTAEARGRELQWKMRLGAAYEEELASGGKTFGEIPEWLDDLVRATIEPPADWSALLQHAITSLHRTDRSYLRPSRRMSAVAEHEGGWPETVSMPGRRIEHAGHLVTVVDTSASVRPDTLARFLGAIVAAATAEGIDEIRLMQADAAVTRDERLFAAELLFQEIAITGRGGTDFTPVLNKLASESRRQGDRFTVVYLTDLDGRFPSASSVEHLDVLWVVPHDRDRTPPFGRKLVMTPAR
jgi:predicted metal-dependent peptidase